MGQNGLFNRWIREKLQQSKIFYVTNMNEEILTNNKSTYCIGFKYENKGCVIVINKLWLIDSQTCHHPLDLAPSYASFVSPQHPTVFSLYQSINLSSSQSHGELFDALSSNEDTEHLNTRYMCLRRDTLCSASLLIVNVVSALFNEICASRPLLSYHRKGLLL